jgi:electron transport complex protein RnfE
MMKPSRAFAILKDGLWTSNVTLAQQLALCPLMALTGSATNGLGMGLATTVCLVATNVAISLVRGVITPQVRIPAFILVIAGIVTVADMAINAWGHELYKVLGLFIPLIVTNCVILGRAEAFASRNGPAASALDGLGMGLGFTCSLTAIGCIREALGSGTIFANASLMLGPAFASLETVVIPEYKGFLLMILPPGGFLVLAFVLAAKRQLGGFFDRRRAAARS